ncbi:MAG: hypothetical protein ACFB02_18170 [Mastigocoleus sp.]
MTNTRTYRNNSAEKDSEIWYSLKSAIAATSGFERWQMERNLQLQDLSLDKQVQFYLRETLETLAY